MNRTPPTSHPNEKLFDLEELSPHFSSSNRIQILTRAVTRSLSIDQLNSDYRRFLHLHKKGIPFFRAACEVLNIFYKFPSEDLRQIPHEGPLVVVANHPFGIIDSLILGDILSSVRTDFKFMANYLLQRILGIDPFLIPVSPFGGPEATRGNRRSVRTSLNWLSLGGTLVIFPSGTVSHLSIRDGTIMDPKWNPQIGSLIRKTRASVLPFYFQGHNSWMFQAAGMINPKFRTALLIREIYQQNTKPIEVVVGNHLPFQELDEFPSNEQMMSYIRIKTEVLSARKKNVVSGPARKKLFEKPAPKAVIAPVEPIQLRNEILQLPSEGRLLQTGEFGVYLIQYHQAPLLMKEIGRLRETTFREIGEGTGRSFDLDRFDRHYLHLVLWNEEQREIVGSYRLGLVDHILKTMGKRGLYTTTLFRFKPGFYHPLNQAVELGRSFIRSSYQRKFSSLHLLWRGIGEFLVQNPRYRYLFGPVSISNNYHPMSTGLLVQFLKQTFTNHEITTQVKAHRPFPGFGSPGRTLSAQDLPFEDIEQVSSIISEIEEDGKGAPILFRQYLKLNATFLGFNRDPAFSNVVDGLVWVDLLQAEARFLKRFLGDEGYDTYLHHQLTFHDYSKAA